MTSIWGPLGWMTLHSISANYPEQPSESDKLILKRYLSLFIETITCPTCKGHFGSMYNSYVVRFPRWADSRADLFLFVCRAHNTVNMRLDKHRLPSVSECVTALRYAARVTDPATYRAQYHNYLQRNWAREPTADGFIMSRSVREMMKINAEYWCLRETGFGDLSFPETDFLQPIIPTRGSTGLPIPGVSPATGAPISVGFKMRGGKFSLIGR